MHPPTSCLSRVVKTGGGRGDHAVHGQETEEVEVGLVRLRGKEVETGRSLLGHGQLGRPE